MSNTAAVPTKVIIVGCGVAGPVLATLLKSKGYQPVVYERIKAGSDGGLSLMYASDFPLRPWVAIHHTMIL